MSQVASKVKRQAFAEIDNPLNVVNQQSHTLVHLSVDQKKTLVSEDAKPTPNTRRVSKEGTEEKQRFSVRANRQSSSACE